MSAGMDNLGKKLAPALYFVVMSTAYLTVGNGATCGTLGGCMNRRESPHKNQSNANQAQNLGL